MNDYPADRVLSDIFAQVLDLRELGFAVKFELGGTDGDIQNYLSLEVWSEPNENNCFGRAENGDEIEAIISSSYLHRNNAGLCGWEHDDFDCLHRLSDELSKLIISRRLDPVNF